MKKLLFLLLLIPALANAAVTTSFTPSRNSGVAPLAVFFDGTATTSTLYPKGTGSGITTSAALAQGTTAITTTGGSGTIVQSQDYISFATTLGTSAGYVVNGAVALNATSIPLITGSGTIVAGNFVSFANDTTRKIYRVTTGIAAPGSIVITPGLGVGFTGGAVTENTDKNEYQVTGTLAAGTVTIASPGLLYDGGVASGSPVTVLPNAGNFHNIHCETNFGDPNGSPINGKYWTNGTGYNTNRNYATGLVAAHIYETAGTYTATTTCRDANGTAGNTVTNTITVTDPDTVYAGASTKCVYSGTPYGSCPGGGSEVSQANFATALSTYSGANKRVLFKRGDSFTMAASGTLNSGAGGTIGAYGNSALAKPFVTETASGGQTLVKLSSNNNDYRVMDLAFDAPGTGTVTQAIGNGSTSPIQTTVLRVTTTNLYAAVLWQNVSVTPDQQAIVDSNFSLPTTGTNDRGVYCQICTNLMVMGNYMDLTATAVVSHSMRLQGVNNFVVSNNTVLGNLQIGPLTIRGDSQYGSVSDNKFIGQLSVNPQANTFFETEKNIIIERNWLISAAGMNGGILVESLSTSIRNNIFDLTNATIHSAISSSYINRVGSPMTNRIFAYNNTAINTDSNGFFDIVNGNTACNISIENNLVSAPNATNPVLATNAGTCIINAGVAPSGTSGNSSDNEIKNTDPQFAIASPVSPTDFRIKAGSYATNNTGDSAVTLFPAIFDDFFRCKDKTATNFRSGAMVPAENAVCRGVAR